MSTVGLPDSASGRTETNKTVLVVGDSWGALGPSWKSIRDNFVAHSVPVDVKSAAISGTTAAQWGSNKNSLVYASKKLFPHLDEGP